MGLFDARASRSHSLSEKTSRGGWLPAGHRGLEMAKHKEFTVARDVQVYFCDPQSPWQRGTNENTNLLLRQYFPRGTDRSPFSQGSSTKSRCA